MSPLIGHELIEQFLQLFLVIFRSPEYVLERLHNRCENSNVRNHVIEISFLKNGVIRVEGMLYSQYGWKLDLSNQVEVAERQLRLENPIPSMVAPDMLQDLSLSPDAISIVNPDYIGEIPDIAEHWKPNF